MDRQNSVLRNNGGYVNILNIFIGIIFFIYNVSSLTIVESNLKALFLIAITLRSREGATPFP